MSPADAEAFDLERWGTSGGFLSGGYENDSKNGFGTSDNVFGTIPRVISPSVPEGTAILGDWSKLTLFFREQMRIDLDASRRAVPKEPDPTARGVTGRCRRAAPAELRHRGPDWCVMLLDDDYDYVTVPEAARRLNLTEKRVIELARRGVLRSYQDGVLWVQCALVSGAVD